MWLLLPIMISIACVVGNYLIKNENHKKSLNYPVVPGDIHWTVKSTLVIGGSSGIAGILASLLGIGGGMIMSPLMLELEVEPRVTAATSAVLVLFTSLSSIVQFATSGHLQWDYIALFSCCGFFSSLLGQTILSLLVQKYKKKSFIVFAVVVVILTSAILLVVTGIMDLSTKFKSGVYMGFNSLC